MTTTQPGSVDDPASAGDAGTDPSSPGAGAGVGTLTTGDTQPIQVVTDPGAPAAGISVVDGPETPDAAAESAGGMGGASPVKRKRRKFRQRFPKTFRVFLVLLALFVVFAAWFSYSFYGYMKDSNGEPLEVIAATWARDHGLGPVVAVAEDFYYEHIETVPVGGEPTESADFGDTGVAAPVTGKPAKGEPVVPVVDHLAPPANLTSPAAGAPLKNEGVWQPTKATVAGVPAVYVTRVRPDSVHTSVLVSMMWFDSKLAKFGMVPGYQEPGGAHPTDGAMPKEWATTGLASFNGGFRLQDSRGGYYHDGDLVAPLRDGAASAVIYKDGTMKVGEWGKGEFKMSPQVATVRQNLDLIVDNGKAMTENIADGSRWGATTNGESVAWRSAVGQRKDGSIVYIGSPGLSADAMAETMVRAGVVRAMTLDMNNWWVAGFYYNKAKDGSLNCAKLDPAIEEGCDRFLKEYKRDSFAVYGKTA